MTRLVAFLGSINVGGNRVKMVDLKSAFAKEGFQELETNEPNVCLKPENIMMGRIGRNVSANVSKDF